MIHIDNRYHIIFINLSENILNVIYCLSAVTDVVLKNSDPIEKINYER